MLEELETRVGSDKSDFWSKIFDIRKLFSAKTEDLIEVEKREKPLKLEFQNIYNDYIVGDYFGFREKDYSKRRKRKNLKLTGEQEYSKISEQEKMEVLDSIFDIIDYGRFHSIVDIGNINSNISEFISRTKVMSYIGVNNEIKNNNLPEDYGKDVFQFSGSVKEFINNLSDNKFDIVVLNSIDKSLFEDEKQKKYFLENLEIILQNNGIIIDFCDFIKEDVGEIHKYRDKVFIKAKNHSKYEYSYWTNRTKLEQFRETREVSKYDEAIVTGTSLLVSRKTSITDMKRISSYFNDEQNQKIYPPRTFSAYNKDTDYRVLSYIQENYRFYKGLEDLVNLAKGGLVLDLGNGEAGYGLEEIHKVFEFQDFIGIDIETDYRSVKENSPYSAIQIKGDMFELLNHLKDESVSVIILNGIDDIILSNSHDRLWLSNQFKRVLKEEGFIVGTVNFLQEDAGKTCKNFTTVNISYRLDAFFKTDKNIKNFFQKAKK